MEGLPLTWGLPHDISAADIHGSERWLNVRDVSGGHRFVSLLAPCLVERVVLP